MSGPEDPLGKFHAQFQTFVKNNPNVASAAHGASQIPESAKAVVVLSPLSLQHQFPRHWVSKSYRKTIVERPERLLACSMGIGAAVTMYPALFTLKSSHTRQTSLLADHVLKVHGKDWPTELLRLCQNSQKALDRCEVEVPAAWNVGDIYLSRQTIQALQGSIGALEIGVDSIFNGPTVEETSNRAFVALRPPGHHSHASTPSGFCLLNNAHIAIEYAADTYGVTHAVVLDFDLHHGDGTQDICWKRAGFKPDESAEAEAEYNEFGKKFAEYPKVGYFSLHDINSFPSELGYATKENIRNAATCIMDAHDVNIWNVHLQRYETDEAFTKLYQTKYRTIFAKADEYFRTAKQTMKALGKPFKALVVVSAGFDASEFEQASMQRHGVNVPTFFYNMFTKDALKLAQMHSHGKVLSVMEGGYSDGAIASGVFSHLIGLQNQNWINEWGSAQVIKEIVRGCKPNWKPYKSKRARDVIRIWAEEVIKLGRAMIPEFEDILFQPEMEEHKFDTGKRVTRSTKNTIAVADPATVVETPESLPRSETPTPSDKRYIKKQESLSPEMEHPKAVPFVNQTLGSDEDENEDEDYEYDEELNKTFNRTVEDITIDDISRHLESLDIEPPGPPPGDSRPQTRATARSAAAAAASSSASSRSSGPSRSSGSSGSTGSSGSNGSSGSSSRSSRSSTSGSSGSATDARRPLSSSSTNGYKIPSGSTTRHLRNSRTSRLMNFDDSDISMVSHISTAKGHTTRSGQSKW
ncbi:LAME_0H13300g1_1 [Lachancea meyersii CBS 8951]|uniref:LAME_0H13300g1_1 n=1 Tax=Lachancea meyersii CBS 8951 TaxID=1266667 RepID=A0A1G4KH09_9SACH|nr:LAME_0H13300g1_1 [Lachancea meyersii CBS 8951]